MKKLKIAIVVWSLTISGGGARQILEFALCARKYGHKVDIFCIDVDKERCYPNLIRQLNIYAVRNDMRAKIYPLAKYSFFKKALMFVPHFINKERNLNALKNIIDIHDKINYYDVLNYHETEVFKLARFFNKKRNFWMMNDLFVKGESIWETIYRKWSHFNFFAFYKKYLNRVTVLDDLNKNLVHKYLKTEATVVRSGINHSEFYFEHPYYLKKKYRILATGIFFPHRRYEDLIEAMNILINDQKRKNIELNIIGETKTDPSYFNLIGSLVKRYNLEEYISFLGKVSETELKNQYRTSDIFVFPNSPQTWGLAVFEAMLGGCAAIVSRGAGAHEVLKDNETALLVNPKSPTMIAEKINKSINDFRFLQKLSLAGQSYVLNNISWNKYTLDMLTVFAKYDKKY